MITIFADKYLYKLASFLPPGTDLNYFDPEHGLPERMNGIDALLIRTVTPINEEALCKIPDSLQFIGTGSAGTDHIDTQLLHDNGIAFASAAGCNARAVAEYVATALLIWADKKSKKISECTIGIIGMGHVGSALKHVLDNLEIPVVAYDPPRALREEKFISAGLEEVLNTDILTFHTPLTTAGSYPTHHWLNSEKLSTRPYDLIINTSRGGVVNEEALLSAHSNNMVGAMVIDVWDGEPVFNDELARKAFIKTPHIAGYSIQSKLKASKLIADKLIEHFGLSFSKKTTLTSFEKSISLPDSVKGVSNVLASIHPILNYQDKLASLIGMEPAKKARHFNKVRTESPLRNEFSSFDIPTSVTDNYPFLKALFL